MLARFLVLLCEISPWCRRLLWQWWYNKLARQIDASEWVFMNYGLAFPFGHPKLELTSVDEPDRFCIQLYEYVVGRIDLRGREVLEVGSGRGGGASYLARYRKPRQLLGLDFSREAIAFSTSRHSEVANLKFQWGDAENLGLPNEAFDAVVNVESSHCYGNIPAFFREVSRVLKTDGHFMFADLRGPKEMEELRRTFENTAGFQVVEEEDITALVIQAWELDELRKCRMIKELVPPALHPLFNEFAGMSGGKIFEGLKNRSLMYHRFLVRKIKP